ncbi:MAG: SDR family NAD(P)-dependent oxidoreductase [Actinobacteria bacterium]|nr:SDR family NAD(P)-dependent oxidoreductase [Actinomycetota bacterium]
MTRATGKVALITGAGGEVGRSHALRLAAAGADIIAVDGEGAGPAGGRAAGGLAGTAELVRALGSRAVAVPADVRDAGQLRAGVDRAVTELGRLDIVATTAAGHATGPAHELTEQDWTRVIDVALTGAWLTCKVAVPHVIAGGRGGSVVLSSSAAGARPYPDLAPWIAAEHALTGLARTLAQELATDNIRVNVLIGPPPAAVTGPEPLLPAAAQPRDASAALMFLVSDAAGHITGSALPVEAGVLAQ